MYINSVDKPIQKIYECEIKDTQLKNENDSVTTDSYGNQRLNSDVRMVDYFTGNIVKYIPNSIFLTFINMEYFWISKNQQFEVMKPHYLKNAKNLRVFRIDANLITQLDAHIFVEAPNLQYINMRDNKISVIDILAFSGLPLLNGVYLKSNQIIELHPTTFSSLLSLNILELLNNKCINLSFQIINKSFQTVQTEISKNCKYDLKLIELEQLQVTDPIADMKFKDLTTKLNNLTEVVERNNRKFGETVEAVYSELENFSQRIAETTDQLGTTNSSISEIQDLIKSMSDDFEAQNNQTQDKHTNTTAHQSRLYVELRLNALFNEHKLKLLNDMVQEDHETLQKAQKTNTNISRDATNLFTKRLQDSEKSYDVKISNLNSVLSAKILKVADDAKKIINKNITEYLAEAERLTALKHDNSTKLLLDQVQKTLMFTVGNYEKSIHRLWTVLVVAMVLFSLLTSYIFLTIINNRIKMKKIRVARTGSFSPPEFIDM